MAASMAADAGVAAGAEAGAEAIQEQLDQTVAEYARIESEVGRTDARIVKLKNDLANARGVIADKTAAINARGGFLYRTGGVEAYLEGLLGASNLRTFLKRIQYLEIVGEKDARMIDEMRETQAQADEIRASLKAQRTEKKKHLESLRAKQSELEARFRGAKSAARVARFGAFGGFTLPLVGPVTFVDTWSAPRGGGRRHQGTDVMAPCGADVVAVTKGTIEAMSSGGNGGTMLWLRAVSGDKFFYAHLRGWAPGVREGQGVSLGERIAFNGNSGNARGGPCHVHFEWHPGGGGAINPYSLLRAALG
ncbi:MAG: murein hydrolase activator EnvC family protein [Actinomycetota bacterium]